VSEDRAARIRDVFIEALDLAGARREAFLERACAGDASLRAEVEALLAADGAAGRFLDPDVHTASGAGEERVGTRLGPYLLERVIGMGGMGAVYMAERADEEFHKQVAIKILKRGMDTEDILRRFRIERELLAQLEHPGIARLLDSGTTGDGLPYLVMEHIDGVPIDRHCAEKGLDIDGRLKLFREVCDIVRYAHRNLIVHRDLKPGNILVDRSGRVRLLDFGIAKVLDPSAVQASVAVTRPDWRVFTPEYASPEQIRGGLIATSSDIYSLGVLLYELLAGRRPYEFATRTPSEVEHLVCNTEPRRPSDAVTETRIESDVHGPELADSAGLRRRLTGDLDGIVMKALHKEPDRRYATVDALAEDIRRHQSGLPVTARGDTWTYRAAKYVRRHRLAVGAAAAFVVLLFAFAILMSVQAARIASERDRAEREARTANRTSDLMQRILLSADPYRARSDSITVRELLDDATAMIRDELADEPRTQVRLLSVIARVRISHGRTDMADSLLAIAADIAARHLDGDDLETAQLRFSQASLAGRRGQAAEARAGYVDALAVFENHSGATWRERWQAQYQIGLIDVRQGEYVRAREYLDRALALARAHSSEGDPEIGEVLMESAFLEYSVGRFDSALVHVDESIARIASAYGPDHLKLTRALEVKGAILDDGFHDYAASAVSKLRAMEVRARRLGDEHPEMAIAMVNVGMSGYYTGDLRSAENYLMRAERLAARVFVPDSPARAAAIGFLGIVRYADGRLEAAHDDFSHALEIGRKVFPAGNRMLGTLEVYLGQAEYTLGRVVEGERRFIDGTAILNAALGPAHRNTVWAYLSLASLYAAEGQAARADSIYALARPGIEANPTDPDVCYFHGGYWASRGEPARAFEWLERSMANGGLLMGAEYDPDLASIRDRPEFGRLLAQRRPTRLQDARAAAVR
jgi:serine/threonine-protein kinase